MVVISRYSSEPQAKYNELSISILALFLKDLIAKAGHHYGSDSIAKQCIKHYIETGVIENIKDGTRR